MLTEMIVNVNMGSVCIKIPAFQGRLQRRGRQFNLRKSREGKNLPPHSKSTTVSSQGAGW
jgi:hypothetical protein